MTGEEADYPALARDPAGKRPGPGALATADDRDRSGERREAELAAADAGAWRTRLRGVQQRTATQFAALGLVLVLGIALGAGAVLLFAKLADDVLEHETVAVDTAILAWLLQFRSPSTDLLMRGLSLMGGQLLGAVLVVILTILAARRQWDTAVSLVLVVGGAQVLNTLLKLTFQRPRPIPVIELAPGQQFSFPSGHTMVAAAVYLFLAYIGWTTLRGFVRYVLVAGLVLLILAVGVSRVYLEVHYVTDVVAGYVAGFLWVDAVIVGGRVLKKDHRSKGDPAQPVLATG